VSQTHRRRDILPLRLSTPSTGLARALSKLGSCSRSQAWAARIADPSGHAEKIYHVQVDGLVDHACLEELQKGADVEGELLSASRARCLRQGTRNSWIEMAAPGPVGQLRRTQTS
jgi:23S rRNA pseudouridine2605 synthase